MTKLCKCGHPKSHHKMLGGGVRGNGIGSYPPEPHWCLKCDNCKLYRSEKCTCTVITECCTLGRNLIICKCRYGCRGFGKCTTKKCICNQDFEK